MRALKRIHNYLSLYANSAAQQSVLMSSRISNVFRETKCRFSFALKQSGGKRELRLLSTYCLPIILCAPLTDTDLVGEQKWRERTGWQSFWNFKTDLWKPFGFPVLRNKKGEKVTDDTKQFAGTGGQELTHSYGTFSPHIVRRKVQSWINKHQLHFPPPKSLFV